jgi:hypothetical protein
MLALGFSSYYYAAYYGGGLWMTWAPLAAGAVVTSLVIGSAVLYGRWRRRLGGYSREEDLPWEELLRLLEQRNRDRAAAGLPPEEATEEVLGQLLEALPAVPNARPLELPEDREFIALGGSDRRAGNRRWGNPTEIQLHSELWNGYLHGLVVNRSTGGLGLYADREVPAGTIVKVRAVEAPSGVPPIGVEVRHCRKIGRGYFLGCMFTDDIPWNVRVWFG